MAAGIGIVIGILMMGFIVLLLVGGVVAIALYQRSQSRPGTDKTAPGWRALAERLDLGLDQDGARYTARPALEGPMAGATLRISVESASQGAGGGRLPAQVIQMRVRFPTDPSFVETRSGQLSLPPGATREVRGDLLVVRVPDSTPLNEVERLARQCVQVTLTDGDRERS